MEAICLSLPGRPDCVANLGNLLFETSLVLGATGVGAGFYGVQRLGLLVRTQTTHVFPARSTSSPRADLFPLPQALP